MRLLLTSSLMRGPGRRHCILKFSQGKEPDSALDMWMEEKILPALEAVPGLSALLLKMNLQGMTTAGMMSL